MFLKNYTSDVPVSKTIFRIEQVLIQCGVTGIMKEYAGTNGEIDAITFQINTATGKLTIRLPADKQKAMDVLWMDYVGDDADKLTPKKDELKYCGNKRKTRKHFEEQAERTAWKLIQDWIEVQMSMIAMKQADTLQVFLPYVYRGGQTYYQALQASGFKGLLPEKCE